MKGLGIISAVVVVLLLVGSVSATIINVPADQSTIQAGINAASMGDTVLVAPGTHYENINFTGKNITVGSWYITTEDTIYISQTIIDGSAAGPVARFQNSESNLAVLTGFTLRNGAYAVGGAISCYSSEPTITYNKITGNNSSSSGGAIRFDSSNAILTHNIISGNYAAGQAGAIYCYQGSSPTISYNVIANNSTPGSGGGIFCVDVNTNPIISNNTIIGNSSGSIGGGIYVQPTANPVIVNCICWGNTASTIGDQMYFLSGTQEATYCDVEGGWTGTGNIDCYPEFCDSANGDYTIDFNSCCVGSGEGGADIGALAIGCGIPITRHVPSEYSTIQAAINACNEGDTVLVGEGTYVENINFNGKNIVVGSLFLTIEDESYISTTIIDGGAAGKVVMFENGENSSAVLTGFTITNGYDAVLGGGINCISGSDPTLDNNIIHGNSTDFYGGGIYCLYSNPTITNSIIRSNLAGDHGGGVACINSDPIIVNTTIANNTANDYGGGIYSRGVSIPSILNTIIWSNNAFTGMSIFLHEGGGVDITYSDIQHGWTGTGNIDCDPLFCDPDNNDFSLHENSCCLEAGESGADIGALGGANCFTVTRHVPSEYATIQAAIEACFDEDTVLVQPGTYNENIDFGGKSIVVTSLYLTTEDDSYISSTIINSNDSYYVVSFDSGEDRFAVLTGFSITGGTSSWGSGIWCYNSDPTIDHNIIYGNSSDNGGAGILCDHLSDPLITNNIITGNITSFVGGGIFCLDGSNPEINYNVITDNYAGLYGGGLYLYSENTIPVLNNNTIYNNTSIEGGGGIHSLDAQPIVLNTILWANQGNPGNEIVLEGMASINIMYSDVEGGWPGTGNINCDPQFCDPDVGDYTIHEFSCCVDAGDGGVDIGAYGIGCYRPEVYMKLGGFYNEGTWIDTVYAQVDSMVDIQVWYHCDANAWSGSVILPLGINKTCLYQFDSEACSYHYPFTEWDLAEFTNLNDEFIPGHTSLSFLGIARAFEPFDDPWLYFDLPTHILTYKVYAPNNSELVGATRCDALVPGYDFLHLTGPAVQDTTGEFNYTLNDEYACVSYEGYYLTRNVPSEYATIQEAIDASYHGDTVLVQPGTYYENINFNGKNIVVGSLYLTTEDESYISSTIIDGGGTWMTVEIVNGENNSAVLKGFTIQNGYGGVACGDSDPTISHNIITNNNLYSGINCFDADPVISFNYITNNNGQSGGGGIYCEYSSAIIENNIITGNYCDDDIVGTAFGGGVLCGGGGGSIYLANNIISENWVVENGGGIYCYGSNHIILNNTIVGNSASNFGDGVFVHETSSPVVRNTILWGNGDEIYLHGAGTIDLSHSDIQGGWTGTGNIDCDPYFCDLENGDYYLADTSCCVAAGEGGVDIGALGIGCYEPGLISGYVYDDAAEPIESVLVEVHESETPPAGNGTDNSLKSNGVTKVIGPGGGLLLVMVASTYTDEYGHYEVWVNPGIYDLHLSHPSFGDTVIADIVVESGESSDIPPVEMQPSGYNYLPGDVNMSGGTWPPAATGPDVTYLVNFFRGAPTSHSCLLGGFWCSADANGDCNIIGSDVTKLVNVFRGQGSIGYCTDYEPAWPTPADLPPSAPSGWPGCETVTSGRDDPTKAGK